MIPFFFRCEKSRHPHFDGHFTVAWSGLPNSEEAIESARLGRPAGNGQRGAAAGDMVHAHAGMVEVGRSPPKIMVLLESR